MSLDAIRQRWTEVQGGWNYLPSLPIPIGPDQVRSASTDIAALLAVAEATRCQHPVITYAGRTPIHRRCHRCEACIALDALEALP